MTAGRLIDI